MAANVFMVIPVPAVNGAGVPIDTSSMAATKTIIVAGSFVGTVTIEFSTAPSGNLWAPVPSGSLQRAGRVVTEVSARRMRAVVSGFAGGTATAGVGAPAAAAGFVQLGPTPADISALPAFKTVVASGACIVEISEDGVGYSQAFAFQLAGSQSAVLTGQFARTVGGATVWMGGADAGIDAGGSALSDASPSPITDATNVPGTSMVASRGDHQHSHGTRGGGGLHALVTSLAAGFVQFSVVTPSPVRALDVVFQPNATRPTLGIYSVDIGCTLVGPVGAAGAIQLLSDSSNPPTTIRAEVFFSTGGTLAPGQEVTNFCESSLVYAVPESDFVLLATVPAGGGPTFGADFATEITL